MTESRPHLLPPLLLLAGVLALPCTVLAEPVPAPKDDTNSRLYVPSKPKPEEALMYLQMTRGEKLCATPLSLQNNSVTVEQIVEQVKKGLAASPTVPKSVATFRIEVRGVRPVQLKVANKDSTVGAVLSAAALLAGAKVWVFSDHVLIAPESALSPQEIEQKVQPLTLQNASQRFGRWNRQQTAFAHFIADDLKTLGLPSDPSLGVAKTNSPLEREMAQKWTIASNTEAGTQARLAQLSPDAQQMVSELFDSVKNWAVSVNTPGSAMVEEFARSAIGPNTLVEIMPGDGEMAMKEERLVRITLPGQGQVMLTLNGGGFGFDGFTPPAPPPAIPPLDPSAGNS